MGTTDGSLPRKSFPANEEKHERNEEEVANGYQRLGREFLLFVCVHYEFFFLYLFSMNEKSECQDQQPAAISEPNFAVSLLCGLKLVARIISYLILVSNSAAAVALQKCTCILLCACACAYHTPHYNQNKKHIPYLQLELVKIKKYPAKV